VGYFRMLGGVIEKAGEAEGIDSGRIALL